MTDQPPEQQDRSCPEQDSDGTPPDSPSPEQNASPFFIVGVGASAGGLEALERMFAATPIDTGMAFIVLQHLSPDFKSQMDHLLRRQTRMPVRMVENGVEVEPNAIYLIPPKKEMIISHGRLLLTDKDPRHGFTLPIDHFFRSLAEDVGAQAIGVILSGTGSDGSRGVVDISEAGGLVICQSEDTARFDGMPLAAQQTGTVNLILPPDVIPEALMRYKDHRLSPSALAEDCMLQGKDGPLDHIFRLLRAEYAIDFSQYKPTTVQRRIERRMAILGVPQIEDYSKLFQAESEERNLLYKDLLIGVTRFFRDGEAFARLEQEVIRPLIEEPRDDDAEIRVWIAGCATGEEAYSMAILFDEALASANIKRLVKIFATDVHRGSLATASAGLYGPSSLVDVSPERKERYFQETADGFLVDKSIRQMVVFARHSIIADAPFTRLDLVSCRNLLIYLQPLAQRKALSLFHFGLKTQGFLLLGPSETPGELEDEFEPIDKHWRLYRKRRDSQLPRDMRLPLSNTNLPGSSATAMRPAGPRPADSLARTYDQLLNRFMPPSVLVDQQFELLHTFGGAESYLRIRGGRPSTHLLQLIDPSLRTTLAGALQHALNDQKTVRYSGLRIQQGDVQRQLSLEVAPTQDQRSGMTHLLVSFYDDQPAPASTPDEIPVDEATARHTEGLESELRVTKENLHAVIEELETSNEELQAANEELIASNEELQSTNEELHSVNEELYTVNAEHQRKIAELTEMTDDMDNLLLSTDVGVIFLDRELCIRKFTPRMTKVFHLMPQDLGRKIESFAHNMQRPTLLAEIEQVLQSGERIEYETTDNQGESYLLRLLPYQAGPRVDGVVLTLIDMRAVKLAEAETKRLASVVQTSGDAILQIDLENRILSWNKGAETLYGYKEEEAIGQSIEIILPPERVEESRQMIARVKKGERIRGFETERISRDGERLWVSLGMAPYYDLGGALAGVSKIERDITEQVQAQQWQRLQEKAIASAVNGVLLVDVQQEDRPIIFANAGFEQITGYAAADVIGQNCRFLQGPETDRNQINELRAAIQAGETHRAVLLNYRKNGEPFYNDLTVTAVRDEENRLTHFVGIQNDVTMQMNTLQELEKARAAAEAASAAKSAFLANMSHEIRTPMTTILGLTELLLANETQPDPRKSLQIIRRSGNYLAELVNDILDLSKIEAGKLEIDHTRTSPTHLLLDVCDLMAARAEESGLNFEVSFASSMPETILTDPVRVRQILINLIGNAIKFTATGGVNVTTMLLEQDPPRLEIQVKDTGMGVSVNEAERLFQPFTQADESTTRRFGGTGLGLAISKRLAQALGGDISVHSEVGQGSTFTARIAVGPLDDVPRVRAEEVARTRTDDSASSAPLDLSCRILLAEDTRGIQFLLTRLLESHNAQVTVANNGVEALARMADCDPDAPYDLILMDMHMPEMDGYQTVAQLRKQGCRIPIIALTASAMRGDREHCLSIGCDDYLAKPIDQAELTAIIRKYTQPGSPSSHGASTSRNG
ncbi:chemotaxis protein CheB [Lignipirellula cremea]|uniref:histidine kinase n=1 Tax=Lignipirellula cremea TaxID=2528010 RepID=A0A518DMN8_9BACT|nr:chemotaxis protein CheB [Lignipirellula cremea]QDU93092.1 Aerobic respiration control sensor protein ArcB [Lignipirellula cremea]